MAACWPVIVANAVRERGRMALKSIRSGLSTLKPRLAPKADAHGHRDQVEPWRAWYKTRRWQRLRWDTLVRDHFTCTCGCGVIERDTSKLVADHDKPHRGDPALFWDPDNLKTLRASPCHSSRKQAAEHRGRTAR